MNSYDFNMANDANMLPLSQQPSHTAQEHNHSHTHIHQQQQLDGTRPPPKRRNRQAVSCVSCREKKIKCDRVVPCNQCIKRGEQDQCRIEQKPKIVHENASRSNQSQQYTQQQQPNPYDPLSPGSAVYSQFSAAISTAKDQVNAAQATGSPPPAEVEAIKARLAQVEALLAGQIPLSNANAFAASSPPASANWNVYRSASGSNPAELDLTRVSSGSSPASFFSGHRSGSFPNSTHHSSVSPHGPPEDTDESDEEDDTAPSSPRASEQRISPSRHLRTTNMPISRREMDSDTEDAAMVLERLAMDGGPDSRWVKGADGGCPSLKSAPGTANNHELATGQKFEHCLQKEKEAEMGGPAVVERFERCLQKDKEVGLMSLDQAAPSACPNESASSAIPISTSGGHGYVATALPLSTAVSDVDETSIGQPPCACRTPRDDDSGNSSQSIQRGNTDHTNDYKCLKNNEPLSKEPSPLTEACKLATSNTGLLKCKSGPDTLFGWGMGWAWAAAEVLLEQDKKKAAEEGKPFLVGPRTEREAVLRAICSSLPSKQMAYQLIEVYESRVRYLSGHVVHIPCLKREMEAFYAMDSVEKRARVVNHVDPGWLAMFLTVLALGLRFYPCKPKDEWQPANHLFDGKTIHAWHSAAKTCLVLSNFLNSTSMSVIQAILLLYLFTSVSGANCGGETDSGSTNITLLRIAITNAQEMGLHRLGDLDKQPRAGEPSSTIIRREIAKRIWWALVFRDWSAAGTGCSKDYIIRTEHFNTPLPGNYNDDDLMMTPLLAPRPREEFTEMSYVLSNLEFGMVVKEDVDVRFRRELHAATNGGDRRLACAEAQRLDILYRGVLENAPSFFKVGSEIGRVTCIEVQRWLLQQAVFSKLLRIHRPNLSSRKESRTNCVLLARSILDMQKKIRSRCTVIDRLWVNLMQSFSAAIVLALHLLHTRPTADHRVSVRSEITEAIRALKQVDGNDCAAKKCIRVIEALLEEEEERWQAGNAALARKDGTAPQEVAKPKRKRQMDVDAGDEEGAGGVSGGGRRKNLLSLAQRVALATREDGNAQQRRGGGGGDDGGGGGAAAAAASFTDDPSKRQATMAAVRSLSGAENAHALEVNGVTALKDDASLFRMNNTTLPTSGPSPLSMSGTVGNSGSGNNNNPDDVSFPQMMQTMSFPNHLFSFDGTSNGISNNNNDLTNRLVPPNGVDLMLSNPITPPDGQTFDLAAFLEQVQNSPGSSTDISLSSGHEERSASISSDVSGLDDKASGSAFGGSDGTDNTSVSSFGEPLLTKEAIRRQQHSLQSNNFVGSDLAAINNSNMAAAAAVGGAGASTTQASSPTGQAPNAAATDMDSFWNWIITQGANGISAPGQAQAQAPAAAMVQPPTNTNTNTSAGFDASAKTAPSPAQTQHLMQFGTPSNNLPPTPQSMHSGLTPFLSPNVFFNNTNEADSSKHNAAYPTPSSMASNNASPRPKTRDYTQQNSEVFASPEAQEVEQQGVMSVGTPSAGFGLEQFLGAPLYDFTDFANAWTASNPQSTTSGVGASLGPVSDP
ncbi:hypothetical protein NDA14_006344 [Ustilago hordei]|uniref:Zn(2)-C6 fungal-type domain-containing protein n=1 Tax=Ustilago hordei TaxID=120017 RepID=I2G4Z9_USTHO|nr:uncharacterized protein UHO2_01408 [Ustilago hordei]KAJ1044724.1 hypothetical protein NDA10_007485 [Ustilago hordei]KAJ1583150.1 hypothetical protein NDA15_000983 [Ustilago hordei]KAJ1592105.1 hypothetical protein NDA12_005645 [Ustilago hordei]KAJ1603405.1 hypothetical protein NDA14_006344 [Ustilago hordei]CCF54242.1 uncharacterized protein UHOR_00764 [Ustilago hordei]